MKNGKRSIALAMLLILSLPMATILVESVHPAVDYGYGFSWWINASAPFLVVTADESYPGTRAPYYTNDTLVLNGYPVYPWNDTNPLSVTFNVNNIQPPALGNIVRVQFHIWENTQFGAVFHYLNSTPYGPEWNTRILEKDTKGWARLIEFYTNETDLGVVLGQPAQNFTVTFGAKVDGQTLDPSQVTPEFVVTAGYAQSYAEDESIYWYLGVPQPTVTVDIIPPIINGNVNGTLFGTGCGHHYFNVTFTADDKFGLLNYTLSIAGPKTGSLSGTYVSLLYPKHNVSVTQWIDFPEGTYTVTVTVFNIMSMSASNSTSFYYTPPQKPIRLSPTSGYASSDTWIVDAASGLVNSTHFVYGSKEFGTIVPVSGYGFGASQTVKVTVYIPTYDSYKATYGTFEVLVAIATTLNNGDFSTWFIFPKAPMGTYNVTGVSAAYTCATAFEVLPQVIYNPNSVIGPAVVNVEATGFPAPSVVGAPNTWNKVLLLCNNKDSLLGIDSQVIEDWYIDANGTLQNVITGVLQGRRVHNGIVWPALQPGTYNLTLVLYTNNQTEQPLRYWNSPTWQNITTNYFEHTNTITVQETLSLLISIKDDTVYIRTGTDSINAKLDTLKPIVDRIDGNVVTINTTLGRIEATINQLSPVITRIDGNVVTINTVVGQINTTMATIGPQLAQMNWNDIATIKTSVGTDLSGKVTSIQGDVATIKTDAGDVHAQLPNITNYIIVVIVLTLIAALAAIACVFLVFRKIA